MAKFIFFISLLFLSACEQATETPKAQTQLTQEAIFDGAFSFNNEYAMLSTFHSGVQLWHLPSAELRYNWQHNNDKSNQIFLTRFSPDNQYTITASRHDFALWRISDGQIMGYWQVESSTIRDITLSNEAKVILIGQSDGVVVAFEPATGRRIEFLGHSEKINSIAITANGQLALSGSNDYLAYLWSIDSGQVIHRFVHPSRVTKVSLDSKGQFAFTADSQQQANIWQLPSGKRYSQLAIHARQKIFSSVQFNNAENLLITGSPNRMLTLWQLSTGKRLKDWQVSAKADSRPASAVIYATHFAASQQRILTLSSAGYLETWQY